MQKFTSQKSMHDFTIQNCVHVLTSKGVYLRIYGCVKLQHILPKFVPTKWLLMEIAYQTYAHGIVEQMVRKKKQPWPSFPIQVRSY